MLSAFTARPIIELKQRDKSKIETILAHGDRVLVGLNTGSLRVYRLNAVETTIKPTNGSSTKHDDPQPVATEEAALPQQAQPTAPTKPSDLLRDMEKFSTRAIEQLAIIKEANTLVSLSNYSISLHDLQTYEPIDGCAPLSRTKNASCFAVTSNIVRDTETGIPEIISRMAVAVKRRLLLWSWHESELSPDVVEVVLAEAIRTVTWASATRLVCGMNAGYVLVDVISGAVEDVVAPGAVGGAGQGSRFGAMSSAGMGYMGLGGYVPKPLATKLADGQMLLAKDINTLFITDEGKPVPDKRQIPWQSAPESVGYSYPYILALQSPAKGSLEVRNPDTLSLLQTIALPGAANLHFSPPTVSLAHAGKGFHISSERAVWKMDATDYDSQIEELVAGGKLDEAISVLGMLEDALLRDKTETMRSIKMQKAEVLFRAKKYRESMDLFNEDEVHAPPERVLRLFPKSIVGELSGYHEDHHDEESEDEVNGQSEENDEKAQKEGFDTASTTAEEVSSPTTMGGGFARMLLGHRSKANPETASIHSSKKGADTDDAGSLDGKSSGDDHHVLEGKDLKEAVLELRGFLAGTRARLQRVLDPVTGKLKHKPSQTGSSEDALKSLISTTTGRDESEDELERHLQETFKLVDTCLFRAYMFSAPTLASSLFRIPNFCDPDVVNEKLLEHDRYNELVDFFYGKKLHRQALELLKKFGEGDEPNDKAPGLHGPQRTVGYLQNLPPEMIDLILEFSEWTLRKAPDLAMEVFLGDTENAETLPRDKVVHFLDAIDKRLEVKYLEHIISELNDLTPDFHNHLVELLVEQLKGSTTRNEEWEAEIGRLVKFLKESGQYSLGRAFSLLKGDDPAFYEAQAIVLSNMGEDRSALMIYVFKMQDYAKAEEYCNRVHKSQETSSASPSSPASKARRPSTAYDDTDSTPPSIYHTLLSLYLTPPPPNTQNLEPALDLLSKHGSRLPATSTLSLIPDTLAISDLESYFRGRIRAANSAVNESRVVAGLRETEFVASQALLLLGDGMPSGQGGRNRRVVITDERVCGVCHKRLGGSVVAVLPDNSVVHYGCLSRARSAATGKSPQRTESRAGAWGRTGPLSPGGLSLGADLSSGGWG